MIYYFDSESIPLFALDIHSKNEKADLNADERKAWKAVVQDSVRNYRVSDEEKESGVGARVLKALKEAERFQDPGLARKRD